MKTLILLLLLVLSFGITSSFARQNNNRNNRTATATMTITARVIHESVKVCEDFITILGESQSHIMTTIIDEDLNESEYIGSYNVIQIDKEQLKNKKLTIVFL
jgi:hypothetical protein